MNILDNHIIDIDDRIKDICKTAPSTGGSSIQESLSSYGWILLDSYIAWRTLRFLIRDQVLNPDIQKKWFQTPSSFTASQIRAVWRFGDNLDLYFGKKTSHNLKYIIDEEIEKSRNSSAHFSTNGIVKGGDYQKILLYHSLFSNTFLFYEIFYFFISLSNNLINSAQTSLKMFDEDENKLFEYSISDQPINYDLEIVDIDLISNIKIEFRENDVDVCINFDRDGCYFNDDIDNRIRTFNLFSNKGYYRDTSSIKKRLRELCPQSLLS